MRLTQAAICEVQSVVLDELMAISWNSRWHAGTENSMHN